jgi:hypothetical protein
MWKEKGLDLISPNDFENEVYEEFVVFALEKALEEETQPTTSICFRESTWSAVLKEFQDVCNRFYP